MFDSYTRIENETQINFINIASSKLLTYVKFKLKLNFYLRNFRYIPFTNNELSYNLNEVEIKVVHL